MKYLYITITLLLPTFVIGQGWENTFGGSGDDYGASVQQTTDGGYIITGTTDSGGLNGNSDVWLIKTDSQGDSLWTKTFGGSNNDYSVEHQQTTDGGYIITGFTESYGNGNSDVWLIKTDSQGDSLWTKTFGGSDVDVGNSVQKTTDGGYIITGFTESYGNGNSDLWLIKTDSQGDSLWTKTFGGSGFENGLSVQQTTDGGYIIAGQIDSGGPNGNLDLWLIKTDSQGDSLWTKTFGGSGFDYPSSVQQTNDGGYIITGAYDSGGLNGNLDLWLIKTDSQGDSLWTKTFGGSYLEAGNSVQQTTDGGYVITGAYDSGGLNENSDVWLIKTDSQGNYFWVNVIENTTNITIHPNPTQDQIIIDIKGYSGEVNIEVYDLSGRLLQSTNNTSISLKEYAKGIYIFKVSYGEVIEKVRVVRD